MYVHHVPGRLRVKIARLQGNSGFGLVIREDLRLLGGVTDVDVNEMTGSLIVHYDRRRVSIAEIWRLLHRAGLVASALPPISVESPQEFRQAEVEGAEKLAERFIGFVLEKAIELSVRALLAQLV
ncbi:MAG TPA: hypothetical protein VGF34_16845 [Stellaceae bacterium]